MPIPPVTIIVPLVTLVESIPAFAVILANAPIELPELPETENEAPVALVNEIALPCA